MTQDVMREERVKHLIRSVGVEVEGEIIPFFVENASGKFRLNPTLKKVEVADEQLRTLPVAADVPAKIPADGLPLPVLKNLVQVGLKGGMV
ncbi:MAG: hypothetical protein ACREN8_11925 [Candidatus Dormibacteraceae bacterium]